MTREADREKVFSENLDRLLAGETPDIDPSMDDDFRTALRFTTKMVAARPDPGTRLKVNVKQQLLNRFAEDEAKDRTTASHRWFYRFFHQPRLVAAAAGILAMVVIGILWSSGVFTHGIAPTPPGTVLRVDGSTNKAVYNRGEPVAVRIALKNVTGKPFTLEKFPPVLSLMRQDTREAVYTFGAGTSAVTLASGQQKEFTLYWDQLDARGAMVPAGSYYIELEDIDYQGQTIKLNLTGLVQFEIRPSYQGLIIIPGYDLCLLPVSP
jgi:hypothetical protein